MWRGAFNEAVMVKLKRILAALILVSVVALGWAIWRHAAQRAPEELIELLPENVDLALANLHYTQNENGRRRWTLDADSAEYLKDNQSVELKQVAFLYHQAAAAGEIELTAEFGRFDQNTRELDVWGDVVVTTARDERLTTERLHYDDRTQLLSTDDAFRFTSPQLDVSGTGLRVDVERGRLLVKEHDKTTVRPEKEKAD